MAPTATHKSRQVFLSYPGEDRAVTDRMARDLENAGIRAWLDHRSIELGTPDWERSIREAVEGADALVLVCTTNTPGSEYVRAELKLAEESGRRIIPAWAGGARWTDCVPLGLITHQRIDLRDERYAPGMLELIGQLRAGSAGSVPEAADLGEEPGRDASQETGRLARDARGERLVRQARLVRHRFRLVRPVLGITLPHVNFERGAHYLTRSVEHFVRKLSQAQEPGAPAAEHGAPVTDSDRNLVERLSRGGAHLGLKAEAGMGKSALLEQLAYASAALLAEAPLERPLPVFIRLGDVQGGNDIAAQVERQLLREWGGELEASDLEECEFIAFVDGLDELPADDGSRWLERAVESSLLDLIGGGLEVGGRRLRAKSSLLASRPEGTHRCNLLPHFRSDSARESGAAPQILELKRFGIQDRATYVRRFFGAYGDEGRPADAGHTVAEALIRELRSDGSAARVADTPLLLFLLCYLNSHGSAGAEISLPNTAPQLLLAGIRHNLTRRDSRMGEAHLIACACLAFEHRVRGALTAEAAAASLAALCQEDIADPVGGLAARLGVRRAPVNEVPSVDHAGLGHLVRAVLCTRTGLFQLAGEQIRPTDVRAGDVLAALHLQRLARAHGFGFDHAGKRPEPAAAPCILDPHRAEPARETVAQALSRWAWDAAKWRSVFHGLAVLLAEEGAAAPLVRLLSESDPVESINPRGDDDGGHRLILAVECWRLGNVASAGRGGLDALAPELKAQGLKRPARHSALREALEQLEGRETRLRFYEGGGYHVEQAPLPAVEKVIARLEEKKQHGDSFDPLVECLREIVAGGLPPGELPVPMLQRLADGIMGAEWYQYDEDLLVETVSALRIDALKHLPFVERVVSIREDPEREDSPGLIKYMVARPVLTQALERALVGAIDDPQALRALFGLQLDRSRELYHPASDVLTGWQRGRVEGVDGRRVSPETTRLLCEYIESGLPGCWGTSAQDSAIRLLARLIPSSPDEHDFVSRTLCKVLETPDFQPAYVVLLYFYGLSQYGLDYEALLKSVYVFADNFAHERNVTLIVHAALYCLDRIGPAAALDGVRDLISRFPSQETDILMRVMSFDIATVKALGMLGSALGLADTDPDWGRSGTLRSAGMDFIQRNAAALLNEEQFLTALLDSLRERGGGFYYAEDIAELLLRETRDEGFARRLLSLPAAKERPLRFINKLVTEHAGLVFDAGLRFRRSADSQTFDWVETPEALSAGRAARRPA